MGDYSDRPMVSPERPTVSVDPAKLGMASKVKSPLPPRPGAEKSSLNTSQVAKQQFGATPEQSSDNRFNAAQQRKITQEHNSRYEAQADRRLFAKLNEAKSEHQEQISLHEEQISLHKEQIKKLDSQIKKSTSIGNRILSSLFKKRGKNLEAPSEIKLKREIKKHHQKKIEESSGEIDKSLDQINKIQSHPLMIKSKEVSKILTGLNQSVTKNGSTNPNDPSIGGLFAKTQETVLNKASGEASGAMSDLFRSSPRVTVKDARGPDSHVEVKGRDSVPRRATGPALEAAMGQAFVSVLKAMAKTALPEDQAESFCKTLENRSFARGEEAAVFGQEAADTPTLPLKFIKLMAACRQKLSNDVFAGIIPVDHGSQGSSPYMFKEHPDADQKSFTYTFLPNGKLEIKINQLYTVMDRNRFTEDNTTRMEVGNFQLTTSYTLDADMNLESINSKSHSLTMI